MVDAPHAALLDAGDAILQELEALLISDPFGAWVSEGPGLVRAFGLVRQVAEAKGYHLNVDESLAVYVDRWLAREERAR